MRAIVIEEKIFKSGTNVRNQLIDCRKAFPAENVTSTSKDFAQNDSYSLTDVSVFHFHSTGDLDVILTKGSSNIRFSCQFLTLNGSFDSIVLININNAIVSGYITYA